MPRSGHVLAVTSELPWPLNTGGHLRTFFLLRALAQAFARVTLVVPTADSATTHVTALTDAGLVVDAVRVGRRRPWGEALRAASGFVRGEPYVFYRRHFWPKVAEAIARHVRQDRPDVLYLDHLDSVLYKPETNLPTVLDLHNVYSSLLARTADEQKNRALSIVLRREARLLAGVERRAVATADTTLSVSEPDAMVLRRFGGRQVLVVPNGVDARAYATMPAGRPGSTRPRLLYVGALSWAPNVAAARTLATEILPVVRSEHPGAEVHFVGRNPTAEVLALRNHPGVTVHANVPDVRPHLETADALVVPLEAGGGTRLKILEAFAAGLPVVSTVTGCEGLDVLDDEHLLIASRGQMAGAVLRLLARPALGAELAARARSLVEARYDWSTLGEQAAAAVHAVVDERR